MSEPDDLEDRASFDSLESSPGAACQFAHNHAIWTMLLTLLSFFTLLKLCPDEPWILILPAVLFMLSLLIWAGRSLGCRLQFTTGWLLGLVLTMGGTTALVIQEQPGMRWLALPIACGGWLWLLDRMLRRQIQQREALFAKEMTRKQRMKCGHTMP